MILCLRLYMCTFVYPSTDENIHATKKQIISIAHDIKRERERESERKGERERERETPETERSRERDKSTEIAASMRVNVAEIESVQGACLPRKCLESLSSEMNILFCCTFAGNLHAESAYITRHAPIRFLGAFA